MRYCSVNLRDEAGKKKEQPVRRNGGSFGRAASLQVIHAVVKSGSRAVVADAVSASCRR